MLVLTRKKREAILISDTIVTPDGENIVIRVVEIKGDRIRLGIEAPSKYQIAREELIKPKTNGEQNAPAST